MRFFFEVPEYMFGYPLFDLNDAIRFVVDALTSNGFLAIYYFPKFVYVSWDMEEIEKYKLEKKQQDRNNAVPRLDIKHNSSGKLSLQLD